MEKFALTLQSASGISEHIATYHTMPYEKAILNEIAVAIEQGNEKLVNWFAGFGDGFRQITMNVNEYRRGLDFGFTEIAFNQYGWFSAAKFLDREDIKLEQSEVRIGRGPNGIWTYVLRCCYGTAGSSGPLCVFCPKFNNREAALTAALAQIKIDMSKYLGNSDTSNYKQDVLVKTLKAIAAVEVSMVQLSLF